MGLSLIGFWLRVCQGAAGTFSMRDRDVPTCLTVLTGEIKDAAGLQMPIPNPATHVLPAA
jgi:hypothetical protein